MNPETMLNELYERYVERYSEKKALPTRNDEDIWKVFKIQLEEKQVAKYLKPHVIVASDYEFEFGHSWRNHFWHVIEPLSFDLDSADSIKEKAARWLGRAVALQSSNEDFKMYMLLGKPSREDLLQSYTKAENLLNRIPVTKEFVREGEAEEFAVELQNEIERHADL